MPFKRPDSNKYLIAPTVPGFGRLPERSSGTSLKAEAKAMEVLLKELPRRGYSELVKLYCQKRIDPQVLLGKNREDALDDLLEKATDPPLRSVAEEVRGRITDERVRTGLRQVVRLASWAERIRINAERRAKDQKPLQKDEKVEVAFSWIQDPRNIETVCDLAMETGRKPNTVRRSVYRAIADMLRIKLGKKAQRNILIEVDKPGGKDLRNVVKSPDEIQAIVTECMDRGFLMGVVALLTGVDRKPLRQARVSHWSSQARLFTVPDEKAESRFRTLRVDSVVAQVLDEATEGKRPGDPIFPLTEWQVRDAWEAIREALEMPDLRFKDLRHLFALSFIGGGGSLPQLGQVLGHSAHETTMRYVGYEEIASAERMAATTEAAGVTLHHVSPRQEGTDGDSDES